MLSEKIESLRVAKPLLVEEISKALTKLILEGTLKGGDQLVESELQQRLDVSRSPIREAFRDLEKKGLVVIKPRRGTFVKEITVDDIKNNFPVRANLEGLAARLAHPILSDEHRGEMKKTLGEMRAALAEEDIMAYWEHHQLFHQIWINNCGNDLLIETLTNLRMHAMWFRLCYQYYAHDPDHAIKIHEKIFDLFMSKKTSLDELEIVVRKHVGDAVEPFIEFSREYDQVQKRAAE